MALKATASELVLTATGWGLFETIMPRSVRGSGYLHCELLFAVQWIERALATLFGRHHKRDGGFIERVVVRVDQCEEQLVWPRSKALQNNGIAAGVCPYPGRVVEIHMNMTDARRGG